jgi:transcriptional regulator with XRE-family HTH domain
MLRSNVPASVRLLRRRRRWRQADLAERASVSRQTVSRIERGQIGAVPVRAVTRVGEALEASVHLTVRWQGEELDRLADSAHAAIVELCASQLRATGWDVRTEVSFNHFGERGRVDVAARHVSTNTLLIGEVKSAIGNTQDTTGRLDVKARLGPVVASGVGWPPPSRVVPALVIGESRTARRLIQRHEVAFARFAVRGRRALAWLKRPDAAVSGLLWFVTVPDSHGVSSTRSGRVRVDRIAR